MAHTIREKTKLLNRVRRIRGQIEAVERALEAEKSCAEVMHLVAAARRHELIHGRDRGESHPLPRLRSGE